MQQVEEDLAQLEVWLQGECQEDANISAIRRVVASLRAAIPIEIDEETREYYEDEYCAAIAYWGRDLGDRWIYVYDTEEKVRLSEDWIERGIRELARLRCDAVADLLYGNYDQDSLDLLVQASLFGEFVYG